MIKKDIESSGRNKLKYQDASSSNDKCKAKRYNNWPCERDLFDENYCIFHSEDIEKKKAFFDEAFWNEYERQKREDTVFDFSRFVYPNDISFDSLKFEKNTYFIESQFRGNECKFWKSIFLGEITNFGGAIFSGNLVDFSFSLFNADKTVFGRGGFSIPFRPGLTIHVNYEPACFKASRILFRGVLFGSKSTDFGGVVFAGNQIDFVESIFEGSADFGGYLSSVTYWYKGAEFRGGRILFRKVEFKGESTDFSRTMFHSGEVFFSETQFNSKTTDFSNAVFNCDVYFGRASVSLTRKMSDYYGIAVFRSADLTFENASFAGEKTSFLDVGLMSKQIQIYNSYFNNVVGLFEVLKETKCKIKDFRFNLGREAEKKYPLIKRKVQDAWFLEDFKNQHPHIFRIWKITSNCGRSLLLWSIWALVIGLIFALAFMAIDEYGFEVKHKTFFTYIYYSFVTFSTLGAGAVSPTKWFTEVIVTIEVILGYLMWGGLVSIFANKLARRS